MMHRKGFPALVLFAAATLGIAIAACSDTPTDAGPGGEATFNVNPAAGPPGSRVQLHGLPASVVGGGHWVEVGGQRTPLLSVSGGSGTVLVPAFVTGDAMWPVVPQGAVDVEVHGPNGLVAAATGAFTVQPLQHADGTTEALAEDFAAIGRSLESIADALPPASGEAARFAFVVSRTLDSLGHAPEFSIDAGLAELKATSPDVLLLLDALLEASGVDRPIRDMALRLEGVTTALTDAGASQAPVAGAGRAAAVPRSNVAGLALAHPIELLNDETLSVLMQLAVYLKENTALQASLGSDVSATFGLLSVMGVNLNEVWKNVPVGKVIGALAARASLQALLVNKYLVAALPSRLDSLTIRLASDTLAPDQHTAATVEVHASNQPDTVTLGDLLSSFQRAAGLIVKADYLENVAKYIIVKSGELFESYANENPQVDYDSGIVDLWSVPQLSFKAVVQKRRLVDLTSNAPDVVEPLNDEVNWIARADTSARATIRVEPSVGPATIPVLAEWLADAVTVNSGSASDLVLGSFGEDIKSSEPLDVWVDPDLVEGKFKGTYIDVSDCVDPNEDLLNPITVWLYDFSASTRELSVAVRYSDGGNITNADVYFAATIDAGGSLHGIGVDHPEYDEIEAVLSGGSLSGRVYEHCSDGTSDIWEFTTTRVD